MNSLLTSLMQSMKKHNEIKALPFPLHGWIGTFKPNRKSNCTISYMNMIFDVNVVVEGQVNWWNGRRSVPEDEKSFNQR